MLPPYNNTTQQKIKKRIDDWLTEINHKNEYFQTQLVSFEAENKNLQQELIQTKSDYLKKLGEMMRQGEGVLSQQVKDALGSLEQSKVIYQDKLRISKSEDNALKEERRRLDELLKHLKFLEGNLAEQKMQLQKEQQSVSALEIEHRAKAAERDKIFAAIQQLEKGEAAQLEAKLKKVNEDIENVYSGIGKYKSGLTTLDKEITDGNKTIVESKRTIQILGEKIFRRENEYQKICNELAALEEPTKIKLKEKENVVNAVKVLKQNELAQQQSLLEKIDAKISEKEALLQKLLKEKELIDNQTKNYLNEKKRAQDEIKALHDNKLPQREAELERTTENIEKTQAEIEQSRALLASIGQKVADDKGRIEELNKEINAVEDKVAQAESRYQTIIGEAKLISTQMQNMSATDEKLSNTIKNLENAELVKRETKLKEIENAILKHKAIHEKLLKELSPLENQIQSKGKEKERLLSTIKHLQETVLPQQENKLKEIKESIERFPEKVSEQESVLNTIEQGILTDTRKIKELQDKDALMEREYQNVLVNQKRLSETAYRLEKEISTSKAQYDELLRQKSRLESEIAVKSDILNNAKETTNQILGNIAQQEKLYQDIRKETSLLTSQLQAQNIEKEKLLNEIKYIEKNELPQKTAKLKEIDANIEKQKFISNKSNEDILYTEKQISDKTALKERLLDTIKKIEEIEIPDKTNSLKKITEANEGSKSTLNKLQNDLIKLENEVLSENVKLSELQKRDSFLKSEYKVAVTDQKRLIDTLKSTESKINQKKNQREELMKTANQLRSKITVHEDMILNLKEPLGALASRIREQKETLNTETRYHLQEKINSRVPADGKQWETIFWGTVIALMAVSFIFILWFAFLR
jgi:chromosome segregation ATPase